MNLAVGDRFEPHEVAARGGMGTVYRAVDRETGGTVALKVLDRGVLADERRFHLEARALEMLRHPGIVRYIADGRTEDGRCFLAMDWLEGEDLATRLQRAPLSVQETLSLLRCVASGLAHAHAHGIVHRDIKPANLFLEAKDPGRVKLLDFGIARASAATSVVTRTGTMLGTVGYMSPEQVNGGRDLDARSDIFSLGCVAFECLTGEPAFAGSSPMGVLTKLLLQDTPRVRTLASHVPDELDALVFRCMARDASLRPKDGEALRAEVLALSSPLAFPHSGVRELTRNERRLVSIVALRRDSVDLPSGTQRVTPLGAQHALVATLAAEFGGDLIPMEAAGGVLCVLRSLGGPDPLARGASCALAFASAVSDARVVLVTGSLEWEGGWVSGETVDRALALLHAHHAPRVAEGVEVDEATARLLAHRYEVTEEGTGLFLLHGERAPESGDPRRLLGKPTPCVGREREIASLDWTFQECCVEPTTRVVVVHGEAGVGKSRLAAEFVRRARARQSETTVLIGRGAPVSAPSVYAIAAQLIRGGAGLQEGVPLSGQYAALSAHVEGLMSDRAGSEPRARLVTEFLGELIRAPSGDPSPQLRAARNDGRLMAEQTRTAFVLWVQEVSRRGPLLVVLEDLHWGDTPSIQLLDSALGNATESPVMVLALGRPELLEHHPRLWSERAPHLMHLSPLTRRASEQLVRLLLGEEVSAPVLSTIVSRAAGNAFFLEELIRHAAEKRGDALPDALVALARARVEDLEVEPRRILRAGSVFGGSFWPDAVRSLLGDPAEDWMQASLRELEDRELIYRERPSRDASDVPRSPTQVEYRFRHEFIRRAAYAMLTATDRALGHILAAEWLERAGEVDPLVLADHYEQGGDRARAVPYLVAATQSAMDTRQLESVLRLAERGVAAGAMGEARGALRVCQSFAAGWLGDDLSAARYREEGIALIPRGSLRWYMAMSGATYVSMQNGDAMTLAHLAMMLHAEDQLAEPSGPFGYSMYAAYITLMNAGQLPMADAFRLRLDRTALSEGPSDPTFVGWWQVTCGHHRYAVEGDIAGALGAHARALRAFEDASDTIGRTLTCWLLSDVYTSIGAFDHAIRFATESTRLAASLGGSFLGAWGQLVLATAKAFRGDTVAAQDLTRDACASDDLFVASVAKTTHALAGVLAGEPGESSTLAEEVLAQTPHLPYVRTLTLSVAARASLLSSDPQGALRFADEVQRLIPQGGEHPLHGTMMRLSRALAHQALGNLEEACVAIEEACARLTKVRAGLGAADLIAAFDAFGEHRHTFALREQLAACLTSAAPR